MIDTGATHSWARLGNAVEFPSLPLLVLLIGVVSVLPVGRLVYEAVAPASGTLGQALRDTIGDPSTWTAARHSLFIGLAGTLLASLLGIGLAGAVALFDIGARNKLVFCITLPLIIPPQVTALAWIQVFGPASPMLKMLGIAPRLGSSNPLYSAGGIVLLLGIQYAPLVFLTLRAGLRNLPRDLTEAALACSARRGTVIRTIIVPLMTPPFLAGAALAFVSCIGNFGIPAFLGIPANYLVLPTLIYRKLSGVGPSMLGDISVLAVGIGALSLAGIIVQDVMLRRRDYRVSMVSGPMRPFRLGGWRRAVNISVWGYVAAVLALPIIGLILTSLVPAYGVALTMHNMTFANFHYVLTEYPAARRAFLNSVLLAGGSGILLVLFAVPFAYFLVWRPSPVVRALSVAIELPYAIPGVVLAVACILLFLKPLPMVGIGIYNTIWIILFAYLARFLVLCLRPVASAFRQLDRALDEAGQASGAGLLERLRTIVFPLVAPAACAGALLVFLTAFNELTVSALLWSSGSETLGVAVFSLQQGGDSTYASALSVVTLAIAVLLMLATLLFARRLPTGSLPWRD